MLGSELVKPANPISLTDKQKLNIQVLSYHQAIKDQVFDPETIWKLWPTVGSEDLLKRAGPRPTITAISQYQSDREFREGMAERGIEVNRDMAELTPEQVAAISLLTNYTDTRTPRAKLKALGVPFAKYQGWLKQKPFNDAIRAIAGKGLEEAIPLAEVALSQKAAEGDLPAIKFFMEVTGRHNPAQQQAVDAQQLIAIMVDVAQQVLSQHPDLLRAYIDGVKLQSQAVKGVIL